MIDAAMNGSMDTDMMDGDLSSAPAAAAPIDPALNLLMTARQFVNQGQATQALQAVITAMRLRGGDAAVMQILHRARELYRSRAQTSTDADQLASLFAECAITEAQPLQSEPGEFLTQASNVMPGMPMELNTYNASILAESGRRQIMVDAFSDGSSFICLKCGGLVSVNRKDEHLAFWCQ